MDIDWPNLYIQVVGIAVIFGALPIFLYTVIQGLCEREEAMRSSKLWLHHMWFDVCQMASAIRHNDWRGLSIRTSMFRFSANQWFQAVKKEIRHG